MHVGKHPLKFILSLSKKKNRYVSLIVASCQNLLLVFSKKKIPLFHNFNFFLLEKYVFVNYALKYDEVTGGGGGGAGITRG